MFRLFHLFSGDINEGPHCHDQLLSVSLMAFVGGCWSTKYYKISLNWRKISMFSFSPILFVYNIIKCFYVSIETLEIGLCRKWPLFPSSRNNHWHLDILTSGPPPLHPTSRLVFDSLHMGTCIYVFGSFSYWNFDCHLLGYMVNEMFPSFIWLS